MLRTPYTLSVFGVVRKAPESCSGRRKPFLTKPEVKVRHILQKLPSSQRFPIRSQYNVAAYIVSTLKTTSGLG